MLHMVFRLIGLDVLLPIKLPFVIKEVGITVMGGQFAM